MTNKQIEAVARAICKANLALPDDFTISGIKRWTLYQKQASAAINVMQADKMLEALKDAHPYITDDAVRARVGELITKVEG